MPRTAVLTDPAIGRRIKTRRQLRGWSVRKAAALAGQAHTTWARYEAGTISADNRITLGKIAAALGCTRADLLGEAGDPATAGEAERGTNIRDTMVAFIGADLRMPAPPGVAPELAELRRELDLVCDLRVRCQYDAVVFRLPSLVRGLHANAYGRHRPEALRDLVVAADAASFVVRYVGHPDNACMIAERAQQAADALEDPVMRGLAAWGRAHAMTGCGLYGQALAIGESAAADLAPHLAAPDALPMFGQLLMIQAFARYALGEVDEALAAVTEAQQIAERTGDSDALRLMFGPTNINFWLISMHADGPNPDQAVEIARTTNPTAVASVSRQFAFFTDTARALTHAYPKGGKDTEALRLLTAAERLAPQRMNSPLVRETVRGMLERATRRGRVGELAGLCERIGAAG